MNCLSFREISEKVFFNYGNFIYLLILLFMYFLVCVYNFIEVFLEVLMISWWLFIKFKLIIGLRWVLNEVISGGGFVLIFFVLLGFWLFFLFFKESFLGSGVVGFWLLLFI